MKKIILFFILLWSVNCKAQGWQSCGNGVQGIPYGTYVGALAADTINNILYVGGDFDTINDTTAVGYIAQWNGTTWSSIPALDSISYAFYNTDEQAYTIDAMIMYNGALYLPASITFNGGTSYNYYVIKYDGKTVQWLPALDGQINCFTVYNDTLYIGGDFVEPDTTIFNHVAKWDGTNWQPVGSGFILYSNPYSATLWSLGVSNNKLYAGGDFDQSGNTTHLFSIAQWNDTGWTALNRGIGSQVDSTHLGYVYAINSYQNNLYVGGQFGFAGDDSAKNVAEWNGNKWLQLDNGVEDVVEAFQVYNNKLYVAGVFAINNLPNSNRIDNWDGAGWATVDSGTNAPINCLTVFQNNLYAGGIFDSAGNISANYVARWSIDSTATKINRLTITNNQLSISPNPFSQQATLQFSQPITNNTQLTLYDLTGREVENYTISSGTKNLIIKRNNLPAGMYFYNVSCTPMLTGKIVIIEE